MQNGKRITFLSIFLILAIAAIALSLFACNNATDAIEIQLDGDLYRGAVVPLGADMPAKLAENARFWVTEGDRYCYIYNGNLQVLNDAEVGATITIRVESGERYALLSRVIQPTPVHAVSVAPVATQSAGAEVAVHAVIEPWYADDNAITYSLVQGGDVAQLQGNVIQLSDTADHEDIIEVTAQCGGVVSPPMRIPVVTVQPHALQLQADRTTLQHGQSAVLSATLTPADADATVQLALVRTDYSDWYVTLSHNTVSVAADAPEGSFTVEATAGKCRQTLAFTVAKTPVSSVNVVRADGKDDDYVFIGATVGLTTRVYPIDATYRTVTYKVLDGAEYIQMQADGFTVTTHQTGVSFIIRAQADGVYDDIRFVTQGVPATDILLSIRDDLSHAVRVGDTRTIVAQTVPAEATAPLLLLESGEQYAQLQGDTLTFTATQSGNEVVRVMAIADNIQRYIEFHIVPIPVQQITLSTADNTHNLSMGDTITLSAEVTPANASFGTVSYSIVEGAHLGTLVDNVFTVTNDLAWGDVVFSASTQDGTQSNTITANIVGSMPSPTFADWADLDNNPTLLDGYTTACLDFRALPSDAQDTVVIVGDNVQTLTILGGYDGTLDSCIHNLYFYFLTTDSVTVQLRGVGIVIDNGFTDTVLDFGDDAAITLQLAQDNYIAAGHAYGVSTNGYMVEGVHDSSAAMRRNGMDGFCGLNGGIAVAAKQITFTGEGNLRLVGGNASSGTDGTKGADATLDNPIGGNGGNGGTGGTGGAALVCHGVVYAQQGALTFVGGSSGTGGNGGAAGAATGGNAGIRGRNGAAGAVTPAVVATSIEVRTVAPAQSMGGVAANTALRPFGTIPQTVALLHNHYKVNIYYNDGWVNLHSASSGGVSYSMTKQTDSTKLFRLLRGVDYTLSIFGRNTFVDIAAAFGHAANFYLCNAITAKKLLSSSTVYGLTDDGGNVWYATFDTRPRDTFYSTYYNIMVHEVFHLLYYGLDSTAALSDTVLRNRYNGGQTYTQTAEGVYDGQNANAYFLTTYSKKNGMEDISETMSLINIAARAADYTAATAPIGKKAAYINGIFADYYHSLASYRTPYWMRWVG